MSGSLWLKNGTMRDTLPVIPRPRGGAAPGGRRESCAAHDGHGPTPAVPDAPRTAGSHGTSLCAVRGGRASLSPGPDMPNAPSATDGPHGPDRVTYAGACTICAPAPGPQGPLVDGPHGPGGATAAAGACTTCAPDSAPGRQGPLVDGPHGPDGATAAAGACTTCAPDSAPGPQGPLVDGPHGPAGAAGACTTCAPDSAPGPHGPDGAAAACTTCAPDSAPAAGGSDETPCGHPAPQGPYAEDPLDELADRLDALAADAVHPDEIAAILESDGMTDDHIRLTYGRADSFALAEDLYARVERRHPEPEAPSTGPWHSGLAGCLLRGLVFALPGLAYVLGAPLLAGQSTGPLLAGAVAGWVWNQALSHRAYSWLGLGDRGAAARTLLVGAPAGALVGSAVALAAAGPGEWRVVAFAAGQSVYLGAATVLLVLGRERALLCALLPLAAAVPAFWYDLPDAFRAGLPALSLTATVAFAAIVLRPGPRAGLPDQPRSGPPLTASLPYGLFGLGTGLLVLYAGAGDALVTGAAPVVALTLSMGPAEWLLHRFRSESLAGLRTLTTARAFRRAAAGTLAHCLGAYLAVLLALASVATLLWPGAPPLGGLRLLGLLLVGIVLWLGLLLQAFGAVRSAAAVCTLAAAAQTFTPSAGPAVAGAAAAVLAVLACALLVRPTAHRV
ncbi:hypothetical protein ACFV9D_36950 [Streptomyces sp. NPDC059875]|uniref:hypothetical protein n=1 Tax=unclassified Streptomyces TaxID=2593676 RepID=UPI003652693B